MPQLFGTLAWRVPSAVLLALAVLFAGPSDAEEPAKTVEDKIAFCAKAAEVASAATKARDTGVPAAQTRDLVADLVPPGVQREFLTALIGLVYALDGVEAPVIREVATQMCQKQSGLK